MDWEALRDLHRNRTYRYFLSVLLLISIVLAFYGRELQELPAALRVSAADWARPPDVVTNLVDDQLIIRTPGASLLNQNGAILGNYTMSLPKQPVRANEAFQITIQCGADILNTPSCTSQYHIHFRGPIAFSVPPEGGLYAHDAASGQTVVEATLSQAGWYEVWAWSDQNQPDQCPSEGNEQVPGSGEMMLEVLPPIRARNLEIDHMRSCTSAHYQAGQPGRWVSVGHVREEYHSLEWYQSYLHRNETLSTPSSMPDYIWVPYTCKRLALDYRRSVQDTKDVRHVAYIGDSILRTSYCGNLYTSFHGEISGPCSYSDGLKEYHYSDKTFSVPIQPSDPLDTREHVTFSQRFVDNDVGKCGDRIRSLRHLEPVTHIIANVGMWFAARQPDDYAGQVAWFLQIILDTFGRDVKITWLGTPSVAPGILCYREMNRAYLSRHTSTAASVIAAFKRRYPGLDIGIVDGWPITDHRPETSSDGRHWVREGELPNIQHRPLVSRADDAYMEIIWDRWRTAYMDEMAAAAAARFPLPA